MGVYNSSLQLIYMYGRNSTAEDFAEAVRLYVEDPDSMKADFPARYRVVRRIMKDGRYEG